MIRSFIRLQQVDPGYKGENVLTVSVPFNFSKYKNDKDVVNFFGRVEQNLRGTPGVMGIAEYSGAPLSGRGLGSLHTRLLA
jgi:hypothetical protein